MVGFSVVCPRAVVCSCCGFVLAEAQFDCFGFVFESLSGNFGRLLVKSRSGVRRNYERPTLCSSWPGRPRDLACTGLNPQPRCPRLAKRRIVSTVRRRGQITAEGVVGWFGPKTPKPKSLLDCPFSNCSGRGRVAPCIHYTGLAPRSMEGAGSCVHRGLTQCQGDQKCFGSER